MELIDKSVVVEEIKKRRDESWSGEYTKKKGIIFDITDEILSFIDTLEVKDPYEQCVQYPSIKDGIEAHAETYSFNIESELLPQLTKEQQALWRKEIEQACISGGYAGVTLARDQRYTKWTEEDKSKVEDIVYFLDTAKVHYASTKALDDCIDWLKSLKSRLEN